MARGGGYRPGWFSLCGEVAQRAGTDLFPYPQKKFQKIFSTLVKWKRVIQKNNYNIFGISQ